MSTTATAPTLAPSLAAPPARELSALRRNLLRVPYVIMALGLAVFMWPHVITHTPAEAAENGVRFSLLAGLGLLAAIGIRYPVKMLPVLIFEFTWKTLYLLAYALPLYLSHQVPNSVAADTFAVAMVVILIPFTPWDYIVTNFITKRGEPWR
jgi:hypothetical protein